MYNIIIIFCSLIISYLIAKYTIDQTFINNNDNSTYIGVVTILLFIMSLYIISLVMKSGPKRAIFLDSVVILLLPFYLVYDFVTTVLFGV
jgi:hypothetical protein